jgi:hypothetical protein
VVSVTPRPLFAPGKGPPVSTVQGAGWAPELVWTQEARGKIFCPCRGSNTDRPAVQYVVRHYTDWATPAPETGPVGQMMMTYFIVPLCKWNRKVRSQTDEGVQTPRPSLKIPVHRWVDPRVGLELVVEEISDPNETELEDAVRRKIQLFVQLSWATKLLCMFAARCNVHSDLVTVLKYSYNCNNYNAY